jgi:hypothetical protein
MALVVYGSLVQRFFMHQPVETVVINFNRFKARSRLFLAFDWEDFDRTPEATDLEQQFSASVDCGDRQKAYRATIRDLLKSDDKKFHEKISALSKSQQASCARWLKACKSDLGRVRGILHLREQQQRFLIDIERCADVHSVNLSGLADSSSVASLASTASIRLTESKGSVGLGDSTGSKQISVASATPSTGATKSSLLGKRTQHPDEEAEGQSDTKRPRRAAPTSTRPSMDLSADEAPAKDDQQDQQLVSMDVAEQKDLKLETANGDNDENDDGADDEDDDEHDDDNVTWDVKLRSCVRLLNQDMQELQQICSASSQQMLQVCG